MSAKNKSAEEKMAQSIFYNLSVLKIAVKTTKDFDASLSDTMFIKSNTKAFIHVTHFLFNILDAKGFKSKFYWPITEKKAENTYRSSAVDLINNIITKHNLVQEKVKLPFVVHPFGKKFMSLMLDLVILATKEIMRRRNIPEGKSFDIEKVTKVVADMKDVEDDIVKSIEQEILVIKSKTLAIEELIKQILPPEYFPMPFNELVEAWHGMNKTRMAELKCRDKRIDSVYDKTIELYINAQKMLAPQEYKLNSPGLELITEVAEFYKNVGLTTDDDLNPELSFSWLITQLHLVFPAIINFVSDFSLDPSDNQESELKELNRLFNELVKIETKSKKFSAVFKKKVPELIAKLAKAKEERQKLEKENQTIDDITEKAAKLEIEQEQLKVLATPKNFFDPSKNCLKQLVVKKNRMPLFEDCVNDGKENVANETKLYRSVKSPYVKSKMNQTVMTEMAPPKQQPRRRLDPMALLEQATSNVGSRCRLDLNATSRYTGAIPKSSRLAPKFSSTMLSPDLHQTFFNYSVVSVISKGSPLTKSPENLTTLSFKESSIITQQQNSDKTLRTPVEKSIEMSPKGKLRSLVESEEAYANPPKLELNDETLVQAFESTSETSSKTLIIQNSEGGSESISFGSVMMSNDENLFNISDSIMKGVED